MGILPVFLFHKNDPAKKIKVYALLDNASGGTFVSEKSAKAQRRRSDTDLVLTTIHGTCDVTTKAIEELVVANIKEENVMLALLRTFTQNIIPADYSEIPRPDVLCITCNRTRHNQEHTFAAPRGYVVPQRTVKEQIIPQAVKQMLKGTSGSVRIVRSCFLDVTTILSLLSLLFSVYQCYQEQDLVA